MINSQKFEVKDLLNPWQQTTTRIMNRSQRPSISDLSYHLPDRRVSMAADPPGSRRISFSSTGGQAQLYGKRRSILHHRQSDTHLGALANYCPKLANTYQMEPERKFRPREIEKLIYKVLEERLEDTTYEAEKCRHLVVSLANEIRHKVKQLGFARYKLVCIVDMGSVEEQGVRVASRCLWDKTQDSLGSATYKNESVFAVGTVFGLYHE